jgi:hypothetical protein
MASIERRKIGPLRRQYRRFLDWLWFGPLTRDLYPHRTPSTLSQIVSLLRYICEDTWSLLRRYAERPWRPGE